MYIKDPLRNKVLQLIPFAFDSAIWELHRYSCQMCGPMNSSKVDIRSRECNSGSHGCKTDMLPYDHQHHRFVYSLYFFFFKLLTHYQTTDFRLFQTKRLCRRQFQIRRKWQKVIQIDKKHCWKRRNCSLRAISPFPTVFSKGLFPRGIKRCRVGMG